jgi:hypothetical protein
MVYWINNGSHIRIGKKHCLPWFVTSKYLSTQYTIYRQGGVCHFIGTMDGWMTMTPPSSKDKEGHVACTICVGTSEKLQIIYWNDSNIKHK